MKKRYNIDQINMFDTLAPKVEMAILRLQKYEPTDNYYLGFSGGKDSCVIKVLADIAKVRYDAHYSVTTIDPPELIYFIREHHADVIWNRPKEALLHKLIKQGPPLRQRRWCCKFYKENGGIGRVCILGIRSEESGMRAGREIYSEFNKKMHLYPIYDWTQADIWEFIHVYNIPYCKLYDEGFERLGCMLCPMKSTGRRIMEIKRWPRFANTFRAAFKRCYDYKKERGLKSVDRWPDGDAMFDWWITGKK